MATACENKTDLLDPMDAGPSDIPFQSLLQIQGPVHQPGLIDTAPYSDPTKLSDGPQPSQLISLQPNPSPLFPHQIFQQSAQQKSPKSAQRIGKSSYIALTCSTLEIPAPQSETTSQSVIHNDREPPHRFSHKSGPGIETAAHETGQRQYQLLVNMNQVKLRKQSKYVCSHCGRDCLKPSVLEKHIRSHTGERPFPCTTCGFSFKTQSNLYKHKRTQTHVNNCRLLTGSESGASSSLKCVDARHSDINIQQEDGQKGSGSCQHVQLVPKSNNMDHLGHQGYPNVVPQDMFWSRTSTTEKGENEVTDGQKQDVQQQETPTGNRQISLQRQQATYFAKQWIHKSSSSSVQTNESTDSGYFSHSDSSDQQSCSSGSVQSCQGQSTDTEPGRASQPSQSLISAEQSTDGLTIGEKAVQRMDRNQLGKLELGERISKLISDNKAVVDDKHLENVRPRKMVISKQGSIDLPMPYTFKDSFHFDMKSSQANKRSNLSSNLPKAIPPSPGKLQQTFLSLPSHLAPTVDCLPVIRSNSLPPGEYSILSREIAKVLSSGPEKHCLQKTPSAALHTENSLSRSLDFHPSHHRILVRQTALEDSLACAPIVDGSSTPSEKISNVTEFHSVSKSKHKSLEKRNSQKKLTKFSHEKWSIYGEETFRKKYQAVKRTSSAMPTLQFDNRVTQVSTINSANHTMAQDRAITVFSENQHTSSLATSSIHKIPVRKHLSDPLIFGPVKVTTFNSQMFQTRFLQSNCDNPSLSQTNLDPCHNSVKTKSPLVQELPVITTSSSVKLSNIGDRPGHTTLASALQGATGHRTKGLHLFQPSSVPSLQKEKDQQRSIQRHFSHAKLVRQLSIQFPENKAVQEPIKVNSQQESQPEEYNDANNGVSKLPPAKPPKKKQRLKLVDIGNPTEDIQFDSDLPGMIVPSQPFPFVGILTSNRGHGHLQCTNSPKQLSPTVSINFTDLEQALSNQPHSCPGSVATSSTYLLQFLPSHSEAKAEIREDSGSVGRLKDFPSLSDAVAVQANNPNKVIHVESHAIQCVTPVPPQIKDSSLQKHHFLPKYQLQWAKTELIGLPSALTEQIIVHEETSKDDSQASRWSEPKASHHDQQTSHPTVQPSFTSYQTGTKEWKTEGCEIFQYTFTISEGGQLPSAIRTTAVVTNLIHLMNKRFQWPIGSQPGGRLQGVPWTAANSLHQGRWAPVCSIAHSLLGQCQQGVSNVKLNGELEWSMLAGSKCQQHMCTSGGKRPQNCVQCRSMRERSIVIPSTEINSDYSSFQKMDTQPKLTWCYLRKTVPLHTQQKDRSTSVYATWGTCENTSDGSSLALKDTVIVNRLQQKGRDTRALSLKKLPITLHSRSRWRLAPKLLMTTQGRRRMVTKHRYSSCSNTGRQVDDLYKRGCGPERHKCKECGIFFKKPSSLKIHLQTRANEQAYHCKLCDRSFKTKGNLTKHIKSKIHSKTQAKPQTCTKSEDQEQEEEDGNTAKVHRANQRPHPKKGTSTSEPSFTSVRASISVFRRSATIRQHWNGSVITLTCSSFSELLCSLQLPPAIWRTKQCGDDQFRDSAA
ncbi:zinc finger protein 40-like [Stegostoma tigrinum]|uniref:zinc finger protein 40-like n=1 Tax=Stegostoma tigrinum TaxID=3053191 RepID=UPI00286FC129|nr:zinc finger protein 40-like [Stegostoma tigrinum]